MAEVRAYAHVENVVRDRCYVWQQRLGLDHWLITVTFLEATRDPDDDGDRTVAECKPTWQYMRADVIWYLPMMAILTDEQLDRNCLHEMCHVLLAAEQANLKPSEADRMELSTEYATRALWRAWSRPLTPATSGT